MIVIPMMMVGAVSKQVYPLLTITIGNDGTGTVTHGNYTYKIAGRKKQLLKSGTIKRWPRKARTAAALLQRVLNDAYPEGMK